MFKRNAITFWITLIFLVMAIPAYSGVLDGKIFTGKNGEIGKSGSEDDEIKFENGKFLSVGCAKYGFGDADYTTNVDGDKVFSLPTFTVKNMAGSLTVVWLKAMTSRRLSSGLIKENMQYLNR